jgi:hypothetical protein
MTLETASLERLASALAETYLALNQIIHDLGRSPSARSSWNHSKLDQHHSALIIPHKGCKTCYDCEERQRYDLLDQRYGELVLLEAGLRRAYHRPHNIGDHDLLLSQLDAIQQEMTEILNQLGGDNWEEK